MEFEEPSKTVYTIYSKSGCTFCTKVKKLLQEKNYAFDMIDCDEYLLDDKEGFLEFIKDRAGKEYRTFPIVFRCGNFVGGFTETKKLIDIEEVFAGF
uniref:Glutaredoxin domain-containing protein n=1 Tax=viral metagenome TaxID=1070528 RepID=A0A6C0JG99_9ZZZZ